MVWTARLDRAQERRLARATYALAEAESLAQLPGVVGAANIKPTDAQSEHSYIDDWTARAKRALQRAFHFDDAGAREKARRIARRVKEGARELYEAPWRAGQAVKQKVERVVNTANKVQVAFEVGAIALTGLLAYIAWKVIVR